MKHILRWKVKQLISIYWENTQNLLTTYALVFSKTMYALVFDKTMHALVGSSKMYALVGVYFFIF